MLHNEFAFALQRYLRLEKAVFNHSTESYPYNVRAKVLHKGFVKSYRSDCGFVVFRNYRRLCGKERNYFHFQSISIERFKIQPLE